MPEKIRYKNKKWRGPTCLCPSYKFPHRLGGGLCDGSEFIRSIRDNPLHKDDCEYCNLLNKETGECEVLEGREKIKYCDALRYYKDSYGVKLSPMHKKHDAGTESDYELNLIEQEIYKVEGELKQLGITADTNPSLYQDLIEYKLALLEQKRRWAENVDVPF